MYLSGLGVFQESDLHRNAASRFSLAYSRQKCFRHARRRLPLVQLRQPLFRLELGKAAKTSVGFGEALSKGSCDGVVSSGTDTTRRVSKRSALPRSCVGAVP